MFEQFLKTQLQDEIIGKKLYISMVYLSFKGQSHGKNLFLGRKKFKETFEKLVF
jgi:hypothetical protein